MGPGRSDCFENLVSLPTERARLPDVHVKQSRQRVLPKTGQAGCATVRRLRTVRRAAGASALSTVNSNLRVYLELGNEIWTGLTGHQNHDGDDEAGKGSPDGRRKTFDYDGKGNYRSWHALRTMRHGPVTSSWGFRRCGHGATWYGSS